MGRRILPGNRDSKWKDWEECVVFARKKEALNTGRMNAKDSSQNSSRK